MESGLAPFLTLEQGQKLCSNIRELENLKCSGEPNGSVVSTTNGLFDVFCPVGKSVVHDLRLTQTAAAAGVIS